MRENYSAICKKLNATTTIIPNSDTVEILILAFEMFKNKMDNVTQ